MWKKLTPKYNKEFNFKKLEKDILNFDCSKSNRHFNKKGKQYFSTLKGLFVMKKLLSSISSQLYKYYTYPIVDHAYLLIKSPGGNETPPHQDYVFWENKEKEAQPKSFITFWFAIHNIDERNGTLKLIKSEQTTDISVLNTCKEPKLIHIKSNSDKGFSYTSTDNEANKKLSPVQVSQGECIAFDAYSLHSSTPNISDTHRIALKIVLSEYKNMKKKSNFLSINLLLSRNKIFSFFYIIIFFLKSRINYFTNHKL